MIFERWKILRRTEKFKQQKLKLYKLDYSLWTLPLRCKPLFSALMTSFTPSTLNFFIRRHFTYLRESIRVWFSPFIATAAATYLVPLSSSERKVSLRSAKEKLLLSSSRVMIEMHIPYIALHTNCIDVMIKNTFCSSLQKLQHSQHLPLQNVGAFINVDILLFTCCAFCWGEEEELMKLLFVTSALAEKKDETSRKENLWKGKFHKYWKKKRSDSQSTETRCLCRKANLLSSGCRGLYGERQAQ